MISQNSFGAYTLTTLSTEELSASVCDLGATVTSLRFDGRERILGYDSPELYLNSRDYLGATVGRTSGRVGGSAFCLGGKRYTLPPNDGENHLHGGPAAFSHRRWDTEILGENAVRFTLHDPDGSNGYPGNLDAAVTYRVEGAILRIDFEAVSDRETVYAPTNHMYFDLAGKGQILDARLQIGADRVVEFGPGLVSTGRLLPAEGFLDFRSLRRVGQAYDHCFALNGEHACTLEDGDARMEIYTDFPGLQVYAGEFLNPPCRPFQGLALEPGFFPNSVNCPDFPSVILRSERPFHRWAEYRFSAAE